MEKLLFFYPQIPAVGRTKKTTYSNREGDEREGRKEKSKIDGPAALERRELGGGGEKERGGARRPSVGNIDSNSRPRSSSPFPISPSLSPPLCRSIGGGGDACINEGAKKACFHVDTEPLGREGRARKRSSGGGGGGGGGGREERPIRGHELLVAAECTVFLPRIGGTERTRLLSSLFRPSAAPLRRSFRRILKKAPPPSILSHSNQQICPPSPPSQPGHLICHPHKNTPLGRSGKEALHGAPISSPLLLCVLLSPTYAYTDAMSIPPPCCSGWSVGRRHDTRSQTGERGGPEQKDTREQKKEEVLTEQWSSG